MIIFNAVRFKNFLATGDNFTEIPLSKSSSTLIMGENGAGKSTIIEALSFGLFGKAYRNINKNQLINTINSKDCLVEVEFSIGPHHFKIVRGIKPNIFEIYQNGIMIDQSAKSRDYQKHLEQNILKLNHKSFHQIVVLGSSSFVPFMQLPAQVRREVIEDLLDIQVFSKMNGILKERASKLREEIKDVTGAIDTNKSKALIQKKNIDERSLVNAEQLGKKREQITQLEMSINTLSNENERDEKYIEENELGLESSLESLLSKKEKIVEYSGQFRNQISTLAKESKFYEEHDVCPTCTQSIHSELKSKKIESTKEKAEKYLKALEDATEKSVAVEADIKRLRGLSNEIKERRSRIRSNDTAIKGFRFQIRDIQSDIDHITQGAGNLQGSMEELEETYRVINELSDKKTTLTESRMYLEATSEMLKDTGIKTKIIREYLPVMNTLVNQYLQVMDFFVSFHLDENFSEEIRSRHRDGFSYASFSEGEKQKINLSLLFAWRQISRMKNSMSTNLLILDEVGDSSLDRDGVEALISILSTVEKDTNVFVISHRGEHLESRFESKILFKKELNFSKMIVDDA
jgi:DNA repair exonuclease SbcCD ATPase subunit